LSPLYSATTSSIRSTVPTCSTRTGEADSNELSGERN
jgi:hypothetical protein